MLKREELEKKLNKYFNEYHFDSKVVSEFDELMWKNHNYLDAKTVFLGSTDISSLPEEDLFWFAHLAQNYSKGAKNINVADYYSPQEIKKYSKSRKEKENTAYPLEFPVQQVSYDQWVGTISSDRLMELYNSQVINYNIDTQRNPVVRYNKAGEEQLEINVNKKSVDSIRLLMRNNLFISNAITLNIREDDDDTELDYDEYNGILILKSGRFDIIDGYHRYQAIIREKLENPNFTYNMIVFFTNFDTAKAKRYIAQEDKRNKINSVYAKSLDDTKFGTQIANKMNGDVNFYLHGQFKPYRTSGDSFTIGRIASAIDESYSNLTNTREANKLGKGIVSIANSIIDEDESLIVDDRDMRILIFSMSALNIDTNVSDESLKQRQIDRLTKYIKLFQSKYKYDANKAYSTIKKIITSSEE